MAVGLAVHASAECAQTTDLQDALLVRNCFRAHQRLLDSMPCTPTAGQAHQTLPAAVPSWKELMAGRKRELAASQRASGAAPLARYS